MEPFSRYKVVEIGNRPNDQNNQHLNTLKWSHVDKNEKKKQTIKRYKKLQQISQKIKHMKFHNSFNIHPTIIPKEMFKYFPPILFYVKKTKKQEAQGPWCSAWTEDQVHKNVLKSSK